MNEVILVTLTALAGLVVVLIIVAEIKARRRKREAASMKKHVDDIGDGPFR
jgi:hypothetical protein